jgi:carboxypeptidase PM20D1
MKRSTKIGALAIGAVAAAAAAVVRLSGSTNDVPEAEEIDVDPILEPRVDGDRFIEHLAGAVRIDTSAYEDRSRNDPAAMAEMHTYLADTYPGVHAACVREVVNGQSLLYTWAGSEPGLRPIVLMAHMDVVPVEGGTEGGWTVDPFAGEVAEGHLWGRGTLDDKGPLIAILDAVEHLVGDGFVPRRTIHLAFGHDEEIGGTQGGKVLAEALHQRGVRPWIVLDEGGVVVDGAPMISDRPIALVKVAEKGYVDLKLTATGQGGHSSVPPKSTAAGKVAAAVQALEANPMRSRVDVLAGFFAAVAPRMEPALRATVTNLRFTSRAVATMMSRSPTTDALIRTTTAVTMLSGGVKSNVLPQESWAVVNFRILPGDTVADVLDHVRGLVADDIGIETYGEMLAEPSTFSATEGDAWDAVASTIAETFPEAVVAPWILTGATDSRYYAGFADEIYGFAPFTTNVEFSGIHGTDERVRLADAERAVSFFARLVRRLAG